MNKVIKELISTKEISRTIQEQERVLCKLREQIELQNPQIKEIAHLGFIVVMHKDSISFINYDEPKVEEQYYAINLELNPLWLKKRRDDVTDEDVQKIAKILKIEEAQRESGIKNLQTRRRKNAQSKT